MELIIKLDKRSDLGEDRWVGMWTIIENGEAKYGSYTVVTDTKDEAAALRVAFDSFKETILENLKMIEKEVKKND